MLKIRIIPVLLWDRQGLVKGKQFDSSRVVGSVVQAIRVFNMREVDELVLLDVRATAEDRLPDIEMIDDLADDCCVPFTVGGGIRNIDDVTRLLRAGADKVIINTAALEHPELISRITDRFGCQCVVVSIDCKKLPDGRYEVYTHSGSRPTGIDPVTHALDMEKRGAGEILLTSIDRDGMMEGYDIDLIRSVADAVSVPVIASGGCGTYEHMAQALHEGKATAIAAGAMYQFTQKTPREAKLYLQGKGFPVRSTL